MCRYEDPFAARTHAVERPASVCYNFCTEVFYGAPLAQLDRASGYEPEGREFESLRAHHSSVLALWNIKSNGFLYVG